MITFGIIFSTNMQGFADGKEPYFTTDQQAIFNDLVSLQIDATDQYAILMGHYSSMMRSCDNLHRAGMSTDAMDESTRVVIRQSFISFQTIAPSYERYAVPEKLISKFNIIAQQKPGTCSQDALNALDNDVAKITDALFENQANVLRLLVRKALSKK